MFQKFKRLLIRHFAEAEQARDEAEALISRYEATGALAAAQRLPPERRRAVERHVRRILDRLAHSKGADRWPGP